MKFKRVPLNFLKQISEAVREKSSSEGIFYSLDELGEAISKIPDSRVGRLCENTLIFVSVLDDESYIVIVAELVVDQNEEDVISYLGLALMDIVGSDGNIIGTVKTDEMGGITIKINKEDFNPFIWDNAFFRFNETKYYNSSESEEINPFIKFIPIRNLAAKFNPEDEGIIIHFKNGKFQIHDGKLEYVAKAYEDALPPGDNELFGDFNTPAYVYHPKKYLTCDEKTFCNWKIMEKVYLPEGTLYIDKECFAESIISYIEIPSTVLWIGEGCFKECSRLKRILLPQIGYIPKDCFNGSGLVEARIPFTVEYLEEGCFSNTKLTEIIFEGEPPELHEKAFENVTDCVCFVPEEYSEEYKSDDKYNNIFKEIKDIPSWSKWEKENTKLLENQN